MKKQSKGRIVLFPNDQQLKTLGDNLPSFSAHDLRALVKEAESNDKVTSTNRFVLALRRRNDLQLKDLLRGLGVDSSQPDAWQRGFYLLAMYHHGVGHIAWYPRRTNRNATTWTSTHDLALLREVTILKAQGVSERCAIKQLAADPKKRSLFPYRRKRDFSSVGEQQKREAALRARLQTLKVSARGRSIFDLIVGPRRDALSFYAGILYDLDVQAVVDSLPHAKK